MLRGFGDLEAEIMDRLWFWGRPATVREVAWWASVLATPPLPHLPACAPHP